MKYMDKSIEELHELLIKGEVTSDDLVKESLEKSHEIQEKCKLLDNSIKMLRKTGSDYAKAYTDYRVALAKELLVLKNDGYAITLAGDIARGKPEIAHLKFEEISKEAIYKANMESINVLKLQIKVLENQIEREFGGNV